MINLGRLHPDKGFRKACHVTSVFKLIYFNSGTSRSTHDKVILSTSEARIERNLEKAVGLFSCLAKRVPNKAHFDLMTIFTLHPGSFCLLSCPYAQTIRHMLRCL